MAGYTALSRRSFEFCRRPSSAAGFAVSFQRSLRPAIRLPDQSLLTLPMRNPKGEVLGVLQLINSKRDSTARLSNEAQRSRTGSIFSGTIRAARALLASQAAVSYENRKLYQDIEALFEGFVQRRSRRSNSATPRPPAIRCGSHLYRSVRRNAGLRATGNIQRHSFRCRADERNPLRGFASRFRQSWRARGRAGQGQETLPGQMDLLKQRFDYIRKDLEAGRCGANFRCS